jgi:hypothetical protein
MTCGLSIMAADERVCRGLWAGGGFLASAIGDRGMFHDG